MNDYKYYVICVCCIVITGFGGVAYEQSVKSQERQKELEIKKLELQLKLKEVEQIRNNRENE